MEKIIDWQKTEKKAGRTLDDMYDEYHSIRKIGRLLGVSYDTVRKELISREIEMKRGGINNKGLLKPKSGRKCVICGKDPAPNIMRCRTCNPSESWVDEWI